MRNSSQGRELPPLPPLVDKIPVGEATELTPTQWAKLAAAERKVCTYCGREGHRASQCPMRPFQ